MPGISWFRIAIVWFAALIVGGCSPLAVLNGVIPEDGYQKTDGVAYGTDARQRLDVYQPKDMAGPAPVIVFFYGGSWKGGDRGQYQFVGEALTRRGFVVVIADYRLYPQVTFPGFVEDGAAAVRWTLDEIGRFGGDPGRLFLAGHSAGAHIAALLATDGTYLAEAGVPVAAICGVAGIAGPYSFDPTSYSSVRAIFIGAQNRDKTRPVKQITGAAPPFLLLHGDNDGTVYPKNSIEFAEAMQSHDRPVDLVLIPGIGHYRILLAMAGPFEAIAPVNDRIADFVGRHRSCAAPRHADATVR